MPKLLTEHVESRIRERIPFMARNIHEGIFSTIGSRIGGAARRVGSAIGGVAGEVGRAGKEFVKGELRTSAQNNLDRQTRLKDTMVGSHVAAKLGMSHKEYTRLKGISLVRPTHPQRMIQDPNHTGPGTPALIANPHFRDEFARYQADLEDHTAATNLVTHETGILAQNKSLGQFAKRTDNLIDIYKSRI